MRLRLEPAFNLNIASQQDLDKLDSRSIVEMASSPPPVLFKTKEGELGPFLKQYTVLNALVKSSAHHQSQKILP